MKSIALFAALCITTPLVLAAGMATPPASELPRTLTRSGHAFVARCGDDDFARARFPQKLARECTALLQTWRAEASDRDNRSALTSGIARFDAPRGIPMQPAVNGGR